MKTIKTINKFDRDKIYNEWIQQHDDLTHDEISDYIEKMKLIYENTDNDIDFLKNQDPMEIDDIYMNLMFGEEFMKSNDKGTLKEYETDVVNEYIDWSGICEDNNLTTGDISPEDKIELENIIKRFINNNK